MEMKHTIIYVINADIVDQFGSNSSIRPVESEPSFVKPHLPQPLDLGSRTTTATGIGESTSRNFDI